MFEFWQMFWIMNFNLEKKEWQYINIDLVQKSTTSVRSGQVIFRCPFRADLVQTGRELS